MLLLVVLIAEWLLFLHYGTTTNRRGVTVGFGTLDRQFDIVRHSCEIGLLALALTPIILTAGIDLSVASLLSLCAIVFGQLTHDGGVPLVLAIPLTLLAGAIGGGVNAVLISGLRLPPLIVTLGTYSLFRGLAEAMGVHLVWSNVHVHLAEAVPACYGWIGNGPAEGGCVVHSPTYDFNDALIAYGLRFWRRLVECSLPRPG